VNHQLAIADPLIDRLEYAKALSAAGLLPDAFRQQPANVLLGMELAAALDLAPIVVINELAVIGGKPSFSAKFMRSLVRRAGHRLRESYADGTARCVIVRADDPEWEHAATWDEAKARQHDYWGKGHWKKNPELMLKNRALSECVREACPEVLGGIAYTPDEVEDFAPAKATVRVEQVPPESAASTPVGVDQSHAIADLMRRAKLDKAGALALAREAAGRDVASAADLTADEAALLIELLRGQAEVIDAATGEVLDAELVEDPA